MEYKNTFAGSLRFTKNAQTAVLYRKEQLR